MDALRDLPRMDLGHWPTPLRRLDAVSEDTGCDVWAKLESETGPWGGNKVRKLEYLLPAAGAAEELVTFGAGGSSWAAAMALHGSEAGLRTAVALAGPLPAGYRALYARLGTAVWHVPSFALVPAAAAWARARAALPRRVLLPPGGSGGVGDVGSMRAGLEVGDAIARRDLPAPDRVFVACGTAGTAAGLAAGLGARGASVPVVAVRVTPRPLGTTSLVMRRIRALLRLVGDHDLVAAPVLGDDRFFGPGYGRPTAGSRPAAQAALRDGLKLDTTYGAKAFAALLDEARRRPARVLLFVHTSPGAVPQ